MALVLQRKSGESVWIGNVKVTVQGARVKLVISAPREVPVVRDELESNSSAMVAVDTIRSMSSEDEE